MCCEHLVKVHNDCGCRTWVCNMDLWILWCLINSNKEILSWWEWATVVNVDCVPHLLWWICHSEGLWGRSWADDLATKAFAYISLCLNIDARLQDSLSEMLFNFSDALVPLIYWKLCGHSASGITIKLFHKIMPHFWRSSSFRSAKGAGAADQFPMSRHSLMVFKVGSDSEARRSS